jgi:hypothetical protein
MTLYGALVGKLNIFEWALIAVALFLLQRVGHRLPSIVEA